MKEEKEEKKESPIGVLWGWGKLFFDEWLVCRSQHCVVRIIRCIFDAWRIVQKQCLH